MRFEINESIIFLFKIIKISKDPHKTPCCQTSYCGECIKNRLLEGEEQKCPNERCKKDLTPIQLLEDRLLKQEAIAFKNRNSYRRKQGRELLPRPAASAVTAS